MPFYNERRIFFKTSYSAARKWAQILVLTGVSFLGGQLAAQYGFGNEWLLSRLAFAPPGVESSKPSKVSREAQITSPRVSMKTPLIELPLKATATDLSVVAAKQEVLSSQDVPVPVPVISHVPSDYSKASSETFNDGEDFPKAQKTPVVAKAVRVRREEPSSPRAALVTNKQPEQALTSVTKVDQGSSKTKAKSKSAKRVKVSRRSQKPRVRAIKPSTAGGQPGYQILPKWAGRALFDTSQ